jgi:hypothetical protein
MVRRKDFQGVDLSALMSAQSFRYLACLRREAASMFSSAGQVSSIRKTVLEEGEKMIMSGRWVVTKMSTGNTILL